MSSALIPLQGIQPTFNSPLSNVAQLLQTQDLASQVQLRQSQAQEYQARIAAQNRDAADIDTVKSTLAAPGALEKLHGGDFSDFAGKVSLGTLGKLQDHYKQQVEIASKASEQEHKDKTEGLSAIQDTLGGLAGMKNPDGTPNLAAIQANWGPAVQNLEAAGAFKKAKVDSSKIPATVTSPDQIEQYASQIGAALAIQKQAAAARKEKATTDKDVAATAKDAIETATKTAQQQHIDAQGLLPEEQVRQQQAQAILSETKAQRSETARHDKAEEGVAAGNLDQRRKDFEANYGSPGDPGTIASLADALKKGRVDFQTVKRMKGGQAALSQALAEDPTLTEQRYAGIKAFETGKDAQDLSTLHMLDSHLDSIKKASDAQGLRINPYSSEAAKLGTVATDVAGVMGKLVKSGALTKGEHDEYMHRLNSPLQNVREAAIDGMKEMLNGKKEAISEKFKGSTGMDLPASAMNRGSGTVKLVAPNGQTKDVPADQVDHYLSMGAKKAQ